jgi:hypothetical protein
MVELYLHSPIRLRGRDNFIVITHGLNINIGFEILRAVTMENVIFWGVKPCSLVVYRRFGGTYYLHRLGPRESQGSNKEEASIVVFFFFFPYLCVRILAGSFVVS